MLSLLRVLGVTALLKVLLRGLLLLLLLFLLLLLLLRLRELLLRLEPLLLRRRRGRPGSGSRLRRGRKEGSASRASAHPRGGRHPHHAPFASPPAGDNAGGRAELAGGRRRRRDAAGRARRNADAF